MGGEVQQFTKAQLKETLIDLFGGELPAKPKLAEPEEKTPIERQTPTSRKANRVIEVLKEKVQFVRVEGLGPKGTIYYRMNDTDVYTKLTERSRSEMIKGAYKELYRHYPLSNDIDVYGDTLEDSVDESVDYLDDSIIKISGNKYWDRDSGTTIEGYDGDCFCQLFSNRSRNIDRVQVDINDIDAERLESEIERTYKYIEAHDGMYIPYDLRPEDDKYKTYGTIGGMFTQDQPLNAFWVWANEDLDKFNDLLKAVAANFMRVKPKGAFILIGRTRNGKSSFVQMLHTLFGKRNTSELKLTELESHHKNMRLLGSLLNAPDEEDEGKGKEVLKAQALFKSISTHAPITIPVLYSQEPQDVPTNFMCYFPMNDTPQWKGTGAEACMRRSFILSFDADLSKYDNNTRDFEKETYTADFYSKLLPIILAFAKYYNEHPFKLSDTQKKNQQLINEEVDNVSVYLNEFQKYFPGGYASVGLIWDDYKCWCESRGLLWKGKQDFSRKLKVIGGKPSKFTVGNEVINITRIEKSGAVFHDNYIMWNHNGLSVKDLLYPGEGKKPRSVIEYLNTHANKKNKEKDKEEEDERAKESEKWAEEFWEKRKDDEDTLNAIKGLGW